MAIYTSEPHGKPSRDDSRSSDGGETLQAEELGCAALRGTLRTGGGGQSPVQRIVQSCVFSEDGTAISCKGARP